MSIFRKQLLTLVGVLAATAAFVAPSSAQETKKVRFILDWAFQGHQAPFYLPVDDGTFQKYKLDVSVDRGVGSGDTVAKVASGAYDIGLADLYSMVRFNGANPGHQLLGVMMVHDKSALSLATKEAGSIKNPKTSTARRLRRQWETLAGSYSRCLPTSTVSIRTRSNGSTYRPNCVSRCW